MRITPLDVRKQEFRRGFRGYDADEVRSFLELVANEMEKIKQNESQAEEQLKSADERLGHYRLIEKNLQDAAITVQRSLEETRRQAEKEAELIVRDAQGKAQAEIAQLNERIAALKSEIATLEMQRMNFFVRLRALVNGQMDLLDAMEKDVARVLVPETRKVAVIPEVPPRPAYPTFADLAREARSPTIPPRALDEDLGPGA